MSLVQEIVGLPFQWGGEKHAGWLPKGAVEPKPRPKESDVLDIRIEEESGGYLLIWTGRLTGRHGDTWHETLQQAEEQAEANFDIVARQWVKSDIRRAVERSFPTDVQGVLESLCALRKGYQAQANLLVLANGDSDLLGALMECVNGDWREDLTRAIDWKHNYEKDALLPEEIARRFEGLGLPVPKLVAEQVKERQSRGR
ncbi:MAG TPA: hypothetical protein VF950_11750 [Planctomycetota bacterium]